MEDLQQRWTAAYETFEVAEQLKAAGIWVDLRSKTLTYRPTPIKTAPRSSRLFNRALGASKILFGAQQTSLEAPLLELNIGCFKP